MLQGTKLQSINFTYLVCTYWTPLEFRPIKGFEGPIWKIGPYLGFSCFCWNFFGQLGLGLRLGYGKGKKVFYPSLDSQCRLGSDYWSDDYFVIGITGILLASQQPEFLSAIFNAARWVSALCLAGRRHQHRPMISYVRILVVCVTLVCICAYMLTGSG